MLQKYLESMGFPELLLHAVFRLQVTHNDISDPDLSGVWTTTTMAKGGKAQLGLAIEHVKALAHSNTQLRL